MVPRQNSPDDRFNPTRMVRLMTVLYLLCTVVGMLTLMEELANLFTIVAFHPENIDWNQGAMGGLYAAKPFEFACYLLGCAALGLYAIVVYRQFFAAGLDSFLAFDPAHYPKDTPYHQAERIAFFAAAQLTYAYLIAAMSLQDIIRHLLLWMILLLVPRLIPSSPTRLMTFLRAAIYRAQTFDYAPLQPALRRWGWGLVAFALIEFIYLVAPLFERPMYYNDFLNLSETTLMNGREIDNLGYIDAHHLMGFNPRFDPRRDPENSPALATSDLFMLSNGGRRFDDLFKDAALDAVPPGAPSWEGMIQDQSDQLMNTEPTPEEGQFLRINRAEIHWQTMGQGQIHHQNHVLSPVNEYELGRPSREIFAQYGRCTIYVSWLLLHLLGGVSMQNIYKVSGFYYVLYYVLSVWAVWKILRRVEYAALAALAANLCYLGLTFYLIYFSPGPAPTRHLLDPIALFCAYHFLQKRSMMSAGWFLLVNFLATFNDNIWGLMLTGGFATMLFRLLLSEPASLPRGTAALACLGVLALGLFGVKGHSGPDIAGYFFYGISAYQSPYGAIYLLLFALACLMIAVIALAGSWTSSLSSLVIFWSVYCLGATLYSIWGARFEHFWSVAPLYTILALLIMRLMTEGRGEPARWIESLALKAMIGSLVVISCFGFGDIRYQHEAHMSTFATHKTYVWPFPRAQIISTLNPDYLSDSVALLQKYEPGNGVYILSQYDYLLPFLAGKYSAMPYPDLAHFLLTAQDNQKVIDLLNAKKPEYLFVDRDVHRAMAADLVSPDSWVSRLGTHATGNTMIPDVAESELGILYSRSIERALNIYNVHSLFHAVEADYEPVESSLLLTVYKRRDSASGTP